MGVLVNSSGNVLLAGGNAAVAGSLPLGINLESPSYSATTLPFLNILKSAGQQSDEWGPWLTSTSGELNTGEESYLQLDSNGYATSLTASPTPPGGQVFTLISAIIKLSLDTPEGATYPYEAGTYRLKYIGQGTVEITGDGSLTLSNSSSETYVTGNVTISTPTANGLYIKVTAINSGTDYPRDMSLVLSTNTAAYDSGGVFDPLFLAQVANFSSFRFLDWSAVNVAAGSSTSPAETTGWSVSSYPLNSGSTSLTMAVNWPWPNETRNVYFIDGEVMQGTFTLASPTVSLSSALVNTISSSTWANQTYDNTFYTAWFDVLANRRPATYFTWSPNSSGVGSQVPYEVMIALCNENGADMHLTLPARMTTSDAATLATMILAGTGLASGWSPLNAPQKLRFEYSNETWDTGEPGYDQMTIYGAGEWPSQTPGGGNSTWGRNWYGYQTINIANAVQNALGATLSERFIMLIGGQTDGSTATVTEALWNDSSYWSGSPASNEVVGGVCIAPYFPNSQNWLSNADATTLVANGLNDLFAIAYSNTATGASGYTYTSLESTGWVGYWESEALAYQSLASSYDIVAYEGGPNFYASDTAAPGGTVTGWGAFIVSALRDPRMATIVQNYCVWWGSTFGAGQANINHYFQDSNGMPTTTTSGNGFVWGAVEGTMQMDDVPLSSGLYYRWQGLQDYMGEG